MSITFISLYDANSSGIEWNSRTQDLSNPSLLKIGWAYHNKRLAPRQQNYNPITTPTLEDMQKYKFPTKIGQ